MFEWIVGVVGSAGYPGIALLMFLENLFPPMPSEVIMPVAGFAAARGDLNIIGVVAAGTAGSVAGALPWYWLGAKFGMKRLCRLADRHGRWLTISPADVHNAQRWFDRHGILAVLAGRMIPTVRTLISVPAGIVHMPMGRFLACTTLGSAAWTAVLAAAGYVLESQYDLVAEWMDPATKVIIAAIVLAYGYRLVRGHGRESAGEDG